MEEEGARGSGRRWGRDCWEKGPFRRFRMRAEAESHLKLIFPSGKRGGGVGPQAGGRAQEPGPAPAPALLVSGEPHKATSGVGGSRTGIGEGPRRTGTPPPACLLTKPGWARGRSSAAEACRSGRASDPPPPFAAGEPPHKARPFARGGAKGVSTRPNTAPPPGACPCLRPAPSLRSGSALQSSAFRAASGRGRGQVLGARPRGRAPPPGSGSAPAVPGPRSHLTKPRPYARGGAAPPPGALFLPHPVSQAAQQGALRHGAGPRRQWRRGGAWPAGGAARLGLGLGLRGAEVAPV